MVKEDFPEPETPVTTINLLRGISTSTFFKLCTRAPLMKILLGVAFFVTDFFLGVVILVVIDVQK